MFKFGNFEINNRVVLAPMAGITSEGYRAFMAAFKPGYMVTEMVSDMGLIYGNEETKSYVLFKKQEMPCGVQLFGNSPKNLAKAALICENLNPNIDFYDINMGCPVPKVTKSGAGSALMNDPKLCGEIVRAVKDATHKPVSVKIRLGVSASTINFMDVIQEVENAGVDLIAIHPRTAKEMYGGKPHWDLVKDLKSKVHVPLVVSGNIYTVEDAVEALEITGADAVMVARGGVGNPRLITGINSYFSNEEFEGTALRGQILFCKSLAKYLIAEKGEEKAMRVYRGIATKFFDGFPNSKQLKCRLSTELNTYQDLDEILKDYLNNLDL